MFEPRDPNFLDKIKHSFSCQAAMATLGMTLQDARPGIAEILLANNDKIIQQMGFVHGGVLTTGLDSACGYAALTLAPPELEVMTIELKTSFFAPASQHNILFTGKVLKPGRRAIFTEAEAVGLVADGGAPVLLAKMSATMTYVERP
ncbi:MAG: PaaI family thioesterase [Candidatus Puniceispirillaceae bacterium]|jgi:uncharacterized protein (TIGR00369 family)